MTEIPTAPPKLHLEPKDVPVPPGGLAALAQVDLVGRYKTMHDRAKQFCEGPSAWRARKLAEAHDLLALALISGGRMAVEELDLRQSVRALIALRVPVPLQPDEGGKLRTAEGALLGLTYREDAVYVPQPGYAFVQLLVPRQGVWHAQVGKPEDGQPVCLGESLPPAIPVRELVLLTYGALSMTSVMVDHTDPAGVMNGAAARWWQQNLDKVPLSREPFLPVRTNDKEVSP